MFWTNVAERLRGYQGADQDKARRDAQERAAGMTASVVNRLSDFEQDVAFAGEDRMLLGQSLDWSGDPFPVHLPVEEIIADRWLVTGASGGGKSMFVLGLMLQALSRPTPPSLVVVDMKGELASWLVDTWLPLAVAGRIGAEQRNLLQRIVVINPFGRDYLPQLQILKSDPQTPPDVQAHDVAETFQETIGELGVRQHTILRWALRLSIDSGLDFTVLPRLLTDETLLAALVQRCDDLEVRRYFGLRFPRENRASLESLLARLDMFLAQPETRLVLSAGEMIDFAGLLQDKITIIDLGSPPMGSERTARFFASLLVGKLTRAIMSRPVGPDTPPVWVVMDEWQQTLVRTQVPAFERLLTQARFKRAGLMLVNQQLAQIESASGALARIVGTNTNVWTYFRSNLEDANSFVRFVPTGERQDIRESEERRQLTRQLSSLPDRTYALLLKRKPYGPQFVATPTLDPLGALRRASRVSEHIRQQVARGALSCPRQELERRLREQRSADIQQFLPGQDEPATEPRGDGSQEGGGQAARAEPLPRRNERRRERQEDREPRARPGNRGFPDLG